MHISKHIAVLIGLSLAACSSTPVPEEPAKTVIPQEQAFTPIPGKLALPDRVAFAQKDPRWAEQTMGGSGESLGTDGCLVTASAMALGNLGFETDPSDLNARLKETNSFTENGWLIWSGIGKVTGGKATARYYDNVNSEIIEGCMAEGFYPLTRFILPNGRTHWAMIVRKSEYGFHMRDPLHPSEQPLIFPRSVDAFKAVRCIGLKPTQQ